MGSRRPALQPPLPHSWSEVSLQSSTMRRGPKWLIIGTLAAGLSACAGTATPEMTDEGYVTALTSICIETRRTLDELPEPPEQISIANFATEASNALAAEAEQVRLLVPPDDTADDHRAFIRNTDEQAAAWSEVGAIIAGDGEALAPIVTAIGELTLGRNDLALEMGVSACQRSPG